MTALRRKGNKSNTLESEIAHLILEIAHLILEILYLPRQVGELARHGGQYGDQAVQSKFL